MVSGIVRVVWIGSACGRWCGKDFGWWVIDGKEDEEVEVEVEAEVQVEVEEEKEEGREGGGGGKKGKAKNVRESRQLSGC